MDTKKRRERTVRVRRMNAILRELFPNTLIHLHYGNTWEFLVAVVLSAQCTDKRVNEVTKVLFAKYRTIDEYARAPLRDIERLIHSCGFYRAKARYIRDAARMVLTHFEGRIPNTMEGLTALPGVGRKTANVVLSNAFGVHVGIAVDTHVRRFAIRFDLTDHTDPEHIERDLMAIMPKSEWWSFNHRLVEYGRRYCKAHKHDCTHHPLTSVYPKAAAMWPRAK